jgi:RNA polymerase sigma-70 factor (ECF subfamily)
VWFTGAVADGTHVSDDLDAAAAVFTRARSRLFGVAYRMLGTVSEAEDIVQDVWLKWQSYDRDTVRDPVAFLMTATTRLCITELKSARARRETYIGPWLPEPVDTSGDPALGAERAEALQFATLMLLEKLTSPERAAYVLREAFDYPYALVAETIQVSEVNARQLVSRARKHLDSERREPVSLEEQQSLLMAFVAAAQNGDLEMLEELFAADVTSYTDGNGVRNAALFPVVGRETVAKFVRSFRNRAWTDPVLTWITANGQPALILSHGDGAFETFVTVTASTDGIDQLLWIRSAEKLGQFGVAPPIVTRTS